mgnify:CR=1 FL=1
MSALKFKYIPHFINIILTNSSLKMSLNCFKYIKKPTQKTQNFFKSLNLYYTTQAHARILCSLFNIPAQNALYSPCIYRILFYLSKHNT